MRARAAAVMDPSYEAYEAQQAQRKATAQASKAKLEAANERLRAAMARYTHNGTLLSQMKHHRRQQPCMHR